jgi:hypothetical protein
MPLESSFNNIVAYTKLQITAISLTHVTKSQNFRIKMHVLVTSRSELEKPKFTLKARNFLGCFVTHMTKVEFDFSPELATIFL